MKCMTLCTPAHRPPPLEARIGGPRSVWESFPDGYARPGCPTIISEPIWQLLFFMKKSWFSKNHENPWKSLKIHWFCLYGSSRVAGRWLLGRSERSPRGGGIGPPGAVGVAESRNASGMSTVMSIQVFMAIGGPQIDFFRPKMSHFLNKWPYYPYYNIMITVAITVFQDYEIITFLITFCWWRPGAAIGMFPSI